MHAKSRFAAAPRAARAAAPGPIVGAHLRAAWRGRVDPAWLAGWDPVPFEIEGGLTHVIATGAGPDVVLLPPLPGYKESWLACAAGLARRFRVVTFDLRTRFEGAPRWAVVERDLERVLDALAPGPIGLVGHSLGGALAQRWALARPERVRALVLSSAFARITTPSGHGWSRYVEQPLVLAGQRLLPEGPARWLARRLAARRAWVYDPCCDERILDFVRLCIRDVPLAAARDALRLAFDHDTRAELPRIAVPTLVIVGERESRFALDSADELARAIPGAERRVSPGVSHLHPLSGAAWLVDTLTGWLGPRLRS